MYTFVLIAIIDTVIKHIRLLIKLRSKNHLFRFTCILKLLQILINFACTSFLIPSLKFHLFLFSLLDVRKLEAIFIFLGFSSPTSLSILFYYFLFNVPKLLFFYLLFVFFFYYLSLFFILCLPKIVLFCFSLILTTELKFFIVFF